MGWLDELKRINKINLADRLFPGYYFHEGIFKIAIFFILVLLVLAAWDLKDIKGAYYKCPSGGMVGWCENVFYKPYEVDCPLNSAYWCSQKLIPAGVEINKKPGFLASNIGLLSFGIMLLALVLNHFLHNKGYKRNLHE